MSTILRAPRETCERRCAPRRVTLSSLLPIGVARVSGDYGAQLCPNCEQAAAWVNGELHCVTCGSRHVPDRTFWDRLRRAHGGTAVIMARRVDALEKVNGQRRVNAWRQ